jgi:hypothetical protein
MNLFSTLGDKFGESFVEVWSKFFVEWIPNLLVAVIVFVLGIFIAKGVGRLVARLLSTLYVDKAVEATGFKKILERFGFKLSISEALGLLITWFLYAVVLVAGSDILGLSKISEFLSLVVEYIPNVIVAVVILIVGSVISNFVQLLVKETALAAKIEIAQFLSDVARWAILVFTVMAALIQLNVATELTQILFGGVVLTVALAGGIAFGLGGKDKARDIIEKLSRK